MISNGLEKNSKSGRGVGKYFDVLDQRDGGVEGDGNNTIQVRRWVAVFNRQDSIWIYKISQYYYPFKLIFFLSYCPSNTAASPLTREFLQYRYNNIDTFAHGEINRILCYYLLRCGDGRLPFFLSTRPGTAVGEKIILLISVTTNYNRIFNDALTNNSGLHLIISECQVTFHILMLHIHRTKSAQCYITDVRRLGFVLCPSL